MSSLHEVMSERRQLLNVAYRLLGSLAEAEDAVQETYARWDALTPDHRDAIPSPGPRETTGHTPHPPRGRRPPPAARACGRWGPPGAAARPRRVDQQPSRRPGRPRRPHHP